MKACATWWDAPRRTQHHFCDVPAQDSHHEVASDKPTLKGILLNTWPVIFKSIKIEKVKEGLRSHSSLKETTRHSTTQDFELDPLALKDITGTIRET